MSTINNPYQQQEPPQIEQPMGTPMMPPPMPPLGRRQRRANGVALRMKSIFPRWVSQYAIVVYVTTLMVVSAIYSHYALPWYYFLSGILSVVVFFGYGTYATKSLSELKIRKTKKLERHLFILAIIPRVVFVLLIYRIFQQNYGDSFGFENGDATYYDELGQFVAELIDQGKFHFHDEIVAWGARDDISDMGYGIYVGIVYWLTGNNIIAVRLIKCLLSAWTVLMIYRLAKRNFDDQTARIAAIFVALWPNFWYYCGTHLKETEMVFLAVLFVEQADQMLRSRQFTAWKVIPVLLIGATIFTFRTPLALVAMLALIFSVVMSSAKVVSWGKRVIVGGLALLLIGVTLGNRIEEQTRGLVESVQTNQQESNMEWRSKREHGNTFAKYAGSAVFAPMIFTLPFPTMVQPYEGQHVQQLLNGGNFIKNIISGFIIFALVMLLLSGRWREYMLPLAFMVGYLVVLAFSSFAQSERFHQPVMPFEFMFAAYGLSVAATKLKYKRWFMYWCGLMFIAAIAWNWFKLAGRGLV